jgi:hypothetical protein
MIETLNRRIIELRRVRFYPILRRFQSHGNAYELNSSARGYQPADLTPFASGSPIHLLARSLASTASLSTGTRSHSARSSFYSSVCSLLGRRTPTASAARQRRNLVPAAAPRPRAAPHDTRQIHYATSIAELGRPPPIRRAERLMSLVSARSGERRASQLVVAYTERVIRTFPHHCTAASRG